MSVPSDSGQGQPSASAIDWATLIRSGHLPEGLDEVLADMSLRRVVIDVDHARVQHLTMALLANLLRAGWSGILVVVDRPANYTLRMLARHGVPVESLQVIDLITVGSASIEPVPPRVTLISSPFLAGLETALIVALKKIDEALPQGLAHVGFLLFDNLPILEHYVEEQAIGGILGIFSKHLLTNPDGKLLIPMDSAARPVTYLALQRHMDRVVRLKAGPSQMKVAGH